MTHRKNIFRKLEVNNVHEATKYALRAGIVDVLEYYSQEMCIRDSPYPDPLPDVNIQLYSLPDTSFIEGTVSDKKGVFRLYPMNPGNY